MPNPQNLHCQVSALTASTPLSQIIPLPLTVLHMRSRVIHATAELHLTNRQLNALYRLIIVVARPPQSQPQPPGHNYLRPPPETMNHERLTITT